LRAARGLMVMAFSSNAQFDITYAQIYQLLRSAQRESLFHGQTEAS
jgi:hypothetical protein